MKSKKVEFTPPEALLDQVGETLSPGQRLELFTEYAVKEDGRWCIVRVEGVPFPGYDADGNPTDGKEDSAPRGKFSETYSANMPQGSGY